MPDIRPDDPVAAADKARKVYHDRRTAATNPERDAVVEYTKSDDGHLRQVALGYAAAIYFSGPEVAVVTAAKTFLAFLKGQS